MEQTAKITITMERDTETGEHQVTADLDGEENDLLIGLATTVNKACESACMTQTDFMKLCNIDRRKDEPASADERIDIESTVHYELYQLKDGPPEAAVCKYMSWDWIQANGYTVAPSRYERVYAGEISGRGSVSDLLEQLYEQFNMDKPEDFPGRSMSVSDVVVIGDGWNRMAYYCDRIGFKEIEWGC